MVLFNTTIHYFLKKLIKFCFNFVERSPFLVKLALRYAYADKFYLET